MFFLDRMNFSSSSNLLISSFFNRESFSKSSSLLFLTVSYLRSGSFPSYCKYHSRPPYLEEPMILCNQLFQNILVLEIRIQSSHTLPLYLSFPEGSWFVTIKSDMSHSNHHTRVHITDFPNLLVLFFAALTASPLYAPAPSFYSLFPCLTPSFH